MPQLGRLQAIEAHVDRFLQKHRLFSLPRDIAVLHLLTCFDDLLRFERATQTGDVDIPIGSGPIVLDAKCALDEMVDIAYRVCPGTTPEAITTDTESYGWAGRALRTGMDYADFKDACFQAYNSLFAVNIRGKSIEFAAPLRRRGDRDAVALHLRNYLEERTFERRTKQPDLSVVTRDEVAAAIRRTVKEEGPHSISYEPALAVKALANRVANAMIFPTHAPLDATCGGYSLAEYVILWRKLVELSLTHTLYCAWSGQTGHAWGSVVLRRRKAELLDDLELPAQFPQWKAARIVEDITYDAGMLRPDVRIQPLLPAGADFLLVSPQLILTTNWETCVLRLWARKHGGCYSREVASRKGTIAREFEALVRSRGLITSSGRRLRKEGQTIGDVDVAAFDPSLRVLAIFETKWVIDVDSVREVRDADLELIKGAAQLETAEQFVRADWTRARTQLFPSGGDLPPPRRIRKFLISLGHAGTNSLPEEPPIVPYELACAVLARSLEHDSLDARCDALIEEIRKPREGRNYRLRQRRFNLASYQVTTPAIELPGRHPIATA